MIEINDLEFGKFQSFIFEQAGISLSVNKKSLVSARLEKRLRHLGFDSYSDYFSLLDSHADPLETQVAVDLLTTNETFFFREPKHFDLLRDLATHARSSSRPLRVWSAACSSGEEAYSIAMVLADCMGERPWEVIGSDISVRVLRTPPPGPLSHRTYEPDPDQLSAALLPQGYRRAGWHAAGAAIAARAREVHADQPGQAPALHGHLRPDLPSQCDDLFQRRYKTPGRRSAGCEAAALGLFSGRTFGNAQ
jgi:chemotaxis protein methyltransferase CheR